MSHVCSPDRASSSLTRRTSTCSSRVGSVALEGAGTLETGDAVRFTATGGMKVTAVEAAEVLVWEMHAGMAA